MTDVTQELIHGRACYAFGPQHYECALQEIDRLRADRDIEKKWRKDAEHDREELIAAAVAADRERICLALPGGYSVGPHLVSRVSKMRNIHPLILWQRAKQLSSSVPVVVVAVLAALVHRQQLAADTLKFIACGLQR